MMCRVFVVCNSSFYYWLKHPRGKREADRAELLGKIMEAYTDSKGRYGRPRISAALKKKGDTGLKAQGGPADAFCKDKEQSAKELGTYHRFRPPLCHGGKHP